MFWITGSFNYLWPITIAFLAMIPFRIRLLEEPIRQRILRRLLNLFFILAAIFTGLGNEQVAIVFFFISLGMNVVLYKTERKVDPLMLSLTAAAGAGLIVVLSAPGNHIRYAQEITTWFPEFHALSWMQHFLMRLGWILKKIFDANRLIMLILFLMTSLALRRTSDARNHTVLSSISIFIAGILLISALNLNNLHPEFQAWFDKTFFTFHSYHEFSSAFTRLGKNYNFIVYMIPYLLWLFAAFVLPFLVYWSWGDDYLKRSIPTLLVLAALLSLFLVTFSPTLMASENRIVAVFSVIIFFLIGLYFYKFNEQIPAGIFVTGLVLAFLSLYFQYLEWSKEYFIHW